MSRILRILHRTEYRYDRPIILNPHQLMLRPRDGHDLWVDDAFLTSVVPRPMGGDKRTGRLEALGRAIFAMVEEAVHITLAEIAGRLEREHGERFAPSTVHRFFRRHGWTFKKSRPMPPSRSGPASPRPERPGSRHSRTWTPRA